VIRASSFSVAEKTRQLQVDAQSPALPSENHTCNKRFLRFFIQVTFFTFFNFFKVVKSKHKYVKIQRKILLEDDLAMILLILVCYVAYTAKYLTYLLKSTEVIQIWEFDNLHMTQCAKIIVGFMANVGNVFYPTFTNVFYFLHVFFTFFYYFYLNVYYIYAENRLCQDRNL